MIQETSAGIIIYYKEKYLLLQYRKGHWDFAKGHVESLETLQQTAVRETKEETNLDVEIIPGFREEISYKFRNRDKHLVKKTVYMFIGKPITHKINLSHEHKNHVWLSYDEAMLKLTYKNAQKMIERANRFILSLPYR